MKTKYIEGREMPLCEICYPTREMVAEYKDSIPDANVSYRNGCNECGYRTIYLCLAHAMQRKQVATSRVEQLQDQPVGD